MFVVKQPFDFYGVVLAALTGFLASGIKPIGVTLEGSAVSLERFGDALCKILR